MWGFDVLCVFHEYDVDCAAGGERRGSGGEGKGKEGTAAEEHGGKLTGVHVQIMSGRTF